MDIAILHAGNFTGGKMSINAKEMCCLPLRVFNKKWEWSLEKWNYIFIINIIHLKDTSIHIHGCILQVWLQFALLCLL